MMINTYELVYFKQLVNASISEFNKQHIIFAIRFYKDCITFHFYTDQLYFVKAFSSEKNKPFSLKSLQKETDFKQYFLYAKDFCDIVKLLNPKNDTQISYQDNNILFETVEYFNYKLSRTYSINTLSDDEANSNILNNININLNQQPNLKPCITLSEFSVYIKDLNEIIQYNKFKYTTYSEAIDYVILASKNNSTDLHENKVFRFSHNLFSWVSYKTNNPITSNLYIPTFFISLFNIVFQNESIQKTESSAMLYYDSFTNLLYLDNVDIFFKIKISSPAYCQIKTDTVNRLLENFNIAKQQTKIVLPKSFLLEVFNIASSAQDCEIKFFVEKEKTTVKVTAEHHEKILTVYIQNEYEMFFSTNVKQIYIMFHKNNMFSELIEFYFYEYRLYREEFIHNNQNSVFKFIASCYNHDLQKRE